MPAHLEALDRAIGCFDSQDAFAAALTAHGTPVSSPAVSQWRRALLKGNAKGVPQARCEPIEIVTHARVRVEELRSDLLWRRDPEGHVIGFITPIQPSARKRVTRRSAVRQ